MDISSVLGTIPQPGAPPNRFKVPDWGNRRFGKRVDIPEKLNPEHDNWNYLRHRDAVHHTQPSADFKTDQGIHTTRFKKGFQRRRQTDIELDHEEIVYSEKRAAKTAVHAMGRRERLKDKGSTVNPLTGAPIRNPPPKKTFAKEIGPSKLISTGDKLSPELERVSQIVLRDSHYRFFAPQTTGNNAVKRTDTQLTEGLSGPKTTSVLGYGRAEMYSHGVHDQFAKADYGDPNFRATTGMAAHTIRMHKEHVADIQSVRALP